MEKERERKDDLIVRLELLEELAIHHVSTSPSRFREVCQIFETSTRLEISFWEMGLKRL